MDEKYMKRALELAEKGIGYTNPNPLVGAVIVKDGRIIGEGYHEIYGSSHAEVNAFKNATEDVKGATMYVTLEPCSHYGKTPPCANAIVEKGIKKVVVALGDPNPEVAGRGIKILRDNGIEVVTGVLEEESRKLNEIFLKYITTKLPFCILKTAMTLDGKIASRTGDSKWITGEEARKHVHRLRHRVSSIMVGVGTVLQDNPYLNTRLEEGNGSDPIRVIVDTYAKIPLEANVLNIQSNSRTIIASTELADKKKLKNLEEKGAEIIITPLKDDKVDLRYLMKALGERKIDSVLLEGGSELNYSAIDAGIVDKVNVFIAPKIICGREAKTPVGGIGRTLMKEAALLKDVEVYKFGDDIMIEGYLKGE
ncbi:bifunctional diaminohydroxyphosphoribosylaminopyrimidine deaminase/5-amino-6-(5-phosphoribosylamino)uracil reductase RibD [Clostridium sp. SYSU_GA19001]|uniref:bifunctional diaminohydroxyphosphoribosylaminopyrimidine deaminase/5-amino-6-(5-phosphoribosylamino)uracil reductase RibD n=1 Tax=Clostridium caldaquaticum TaxID=2940653 RepID=UPI002077347B|nr:bifunctional diaminohydroxyphosphoribosylaminopyrimidine deaminase/5-amino-6-(5-phosphoribosylamino)uracil reductase RibD [Clostridium caldaquaticum]MCM8711644.1 bifunctional diaminohydroxyphosphoribosylaminopyrimidine deaminase/5-amino-6-(5-phosphoribosylamino)uracil reductase RibD [Clostridium caldaquaticum]